MFMIFRNLLLDFNDEENLEVIIYWKYVSDVFKFLMSV